MKLTKIEKMFNVENFIYLSILVMGLNTVAWFKISSLSQISSMLLTAFGLLACFVSYKVGSWNFSIKGWQLSALLVLTSILALIGNRFMYSPKNIYSIASVFFNFFVFFSISANRDKSIFIKRLLFVIVFVTTLSSIINLLLYLFGISVPLQPYTDIKDSKFVGIDIVRHRFTGLSANANGLSRVAMTSIFSSFLLYTYTDKKKSKIPILGGISILNLLIIFLTQSRGAINSTMLFFIFVVVSYVIHKYIHGNGIFKILIASVAVLILFVGFLSVSPKIQKYLVGSIRTININQNGNADTDEDDQNGSQLVDRNEKDLAIEGDVSNGRFTLIKNGVKATLEINPIFGLTYSGNVHQVQSYLIKHDTEVPEYIFDGAGSMHNTIVQSFVNNGLLGLIAMVLFLGVVIFQMISINFCKNKRILDNVRFKLSVMNGIFASLLLLNMVEWIFYFDFDNHYVNFILLFVFGWFSTQYYKSKEEN